MGWVEDVVRLRAVVRRVLAVVLVARVVARRVVARVVARAPDRLVRAPALAGLRGVVLRLLLLLFVGFFVPGVLVDMFLR